MIGGAVDRFLSLNFCQIHGQQLDPLIGRPFFEDTDVLFVGGQPGRLSCMGFEFEGKKLVLFLLFGGQGFGKIGWSGDSFKTRSL